MAFRIASSPYTHNRRSTGNIMLLVVLAALPGMAAQWYFFGIGFLIQVLLAVATAWITEGAILRL
ncbi:MAG: electron transport complex subunit RsxD, partial [Pantoea sp. Pent]|nr:electron transport complex subunit RsxD [Pantoea sp. Pent]